MALSPVAVLISGFHCNTDNVYAALSLLAMYLISNPRRRFFAGGLALGAAINVKLIPILLIPVVLAQCRNRRDLAHLIGALAIATIPFLPVVLFAWPAFKANVFGYVPEVAPWGVIYLLKNIGSVDRFAPWCGAAIETYRWLGRWIILATVALVSVVAASRSGKWNALELGTIVYAIFLIVTPGFGSQYLVIVVPLMLSVSIARHWLYSCLGGAFLSIMYAAYLVNDPVAPGKIRYPLLSDLPPAATMPGSALGFLAWWVLLTMVASLLWRGARSVQPMREDGPGLAGHPHGRP
jgi:hypothetical protein